MCHPGAHYVNKLAANSFLYLSARVQCVPPHLAGLSSLVEDFIPFLFLFRAGGGTGCVYLMLCGPLGFLSHSVCSLGDPYLMQV